MKTVTVSISNQWFQTCLPGLSRKGRRVTVAVEIIDFICLEKRFLSLTNCCEERAVTVPGAKGSELSRESYWAEKTTQHHCLMTKFTEKAQKVAKVRNKALQHLQIWQYQARGWCKSWSSSMDSIPRPARTSVVWLPSKGRMINVYLFHCVCQHQPLAWKASNVTPGNVYFIRSEQKGRSSFLQSLAQSSHKSSIRPSKWLIFLSSLIPDGWMDRWMDALKWSWTFPIIFTGSVDKFPAYFYSQVFLKSTKLERTNTSKNTHVDHSITPKSFRQSLRNNHPS